MAALRAAGTDPEDARLTELVGELSVASPDFARLWGRHEVRAKRAQTKHFDHPVVGELSLRFENLSVADAPGQHLVVYHADPDSPAEHALALLGSYAATFVGDRAVHPDR